MTKHKNIIITAAIIAIMTGLGIAQANSANSLIRMDVKRSSAENSVDVTFYTTGEPANSVVTRKSNNRYVVLLPNVDGSSSSAPSIGGVKDLISNVEVKNVDDGIGGYTKVTFNTPKPINIKTYVKKTSPLSQAQKDYKALIAENNTKQASAQTAPAQETKKTEPVKPAVNKQAEPAKKQTAQTTQSSQTTKQQTPSKQEAALSKTQELPKISLVTPAVQKPAEKTLKPISVPKIAPAQQEKVLSSLANPIDNYVPKMKFDENGRRQIDLEPRITHKIDKQASINLSAAIPQQLEITQDLPQDNATAVELPQNQKSSKHFPLWIIAAGSSAVILGALFLVFDAVSHSHEKSENRIKSFFKVPERTTVKRRRQEYKDIIENENLNWKEKYKQFVEKEKQLHPAEQSADMSYITDMSGTKKAVIMPANEISDNNKKLKEKLQAKISQMEHSLSQTPAINPPEEVSDEVKSEDNAISNKFSEIKLKSFAKSVSLKQTNRTLLDDDKKQSRNKSLKEGRFVKLKNSPLSVNKRRSTISSNSGIPALTDAERKYLTNSNNGEMKMDKQNENYLSSSVDEYLSILDKEDTAAVAAAEATAQTLAQIKPSDNKLSRAGITNPISRTSDRISKSENYMNGLIVKSGYNIDDEKGFYLVNMDGVSALVGRVKDDIFILKKFDRIVDKPLQVRQENGSVYIVRTGGFKCLVDVAKDKMGTLIEI